MNKPDFVAIVKSVRTAMKRHSPEILTGIGIAGMITTTVMAVRATPKALILIDEREKAAEFDGSDEPLPNAESESGVEGLHSRCCGWLCFCRLLDRGQFSQHPQKCRTCHGIYLVRVRSEGVSGEGRRSDRR